MTTSLPAKELPSADVFNALQALRPELLGFARARTRSTSEAEDIVQLSLLRAVEKIDTLSDVSKLRAWVYTIVRRNLIDLSRKSGRELLTDGGALPEGNGAQGWTQDHHQDEHLCACAIDLTNALSPGQAALIRLVDVEEHSLDEAAIQVSSSKNAATVRLHRARLNLKEKLREHCGVTDARGASRCSCDSARCETSILKV